MTAEIQGTAAIVLSFYLWGLGLELELSGFVVQVPSSSEPFHQPSVQLLPGNNYVAPNKAHFLLSQFICEIVSICFHRCKT